MTNSNRCIRRFRKRYRLSFYRQKVGLKNLVDESGVEKIKYEQEKIKQQNIQDRMRMDQMKEDSDDMVFIQCDIWIDGMSGGQKNKGL